MKKIYLIIFILLIISILAFRFIIIKEDQEHVSVKFNTIYYDGKNVGDLTKEGIVLNPRGRELSEFQKEEIQRFFIREDVN